MKYDRFADVDAERMGRSVLESADYSGAQPSRDQVIAYGRHAHESMRRNRPVREPREFFATRPAPARQRSSPAPRTAVPRPPLAAAGGPAGIAAAAARRVAGAARQTATTQLPNPGLRPGGRGVQKAVSAIAVFAVVVVIGAQLTGQYFAWDLSQPRTPPASPNYAPLYPGQQPLAVDRPALGTPSTSPAPARGAVS